MLGWRPRDRLPRRAAADHRVVRGARRTSRLRAVVEEVRPGHGTASSAIIACYKDDQAIPIMYERLKATFTKLNIDYEIIFVNDCSPDDTEEVDPRHLRATTAG